jgi:hypothetical protein
LSYPFDWAQSHFWQGRWLLATWFGKRTVPLHEKIGASPTALAAFTRFAKSHP